MLWRAIWPSSRTSEPQVIELTLPALFTAGLAASPHCGLMCGAFQVAQLQSRADLPLPRALVTLHAGRVAGYAALGGIAGAMGQWLLHDLPSADWGRWIQLAAAALLVSVGIIQLRRTPRRSPSGCHAPRHAIGLRNVPPSLRLFVQGVLWAGMSCGVLYSVFGLAALSGSAGFGALLLAAFGLGSVPLLGGSGALVAHAGSLQQLRRAGALVLVAMGMVSAVVAVWHPSAMTAWCQLY